MGSTSALLSWDPVVAPQLAGYRIHYGIQSQVYGFVQEVGLTPTPTSPAFTLGPAWPQDGLWFFVVTAFDISNNVSPSSNEVSKVIVQRDATAPMGGWSS